MPYGLYFSGGVDSSLLASFHDFRHVYTYNDADYQTEFLQTFPRILHHLDYPISSFSPFGLWKLAEEAAKEVKVVISGEGADELFGGYIRYILPHFNSLARAQFPSYGEMFQPAENVNDAGMREFNHNMRELLRMGDRMAAAFGLENRCPFLDRRIIEFAFSLPYHWKISVADLENIHTKLILQKILYRRNPKYQPIEKTGLFCSVNRWLGASEEGYGKKTYMEYQQKLWKQSVSSTPIGA